MIALALAASLALADEQPSDEDLALIAQARALLPAVEAARELQRTRDIDVSVQDPEALRASILAETMDADATAELEQAHWVLRAFRLAPPDFDVQGALVRVLADQIAAYYDPDRRRLVLVSRGNDADTDAAGEQGDMIAAHEWVHALQDQRFDLWAMRNRSFTSGDTELAVLALVEGDATFTMRPWGGATGDGLDVATHTELLALAMASENPELLPRSMAALPALLRDGLIAPYTWGALFARALVREGGHAAVDAAFARPPLSTEHILHPDRYLSRRATPPLRLTWSPTLSDAAWTQIDDDALGELGVRSVIATHHPELLWGDRARVADGWDGDGYRVWRHADGRTAAVWTSRWATTKDAREVEREVTHWLARLGDAASVTRHGRDVTLLVDIPAADRARVLAAAGAASWTPIRALGDVSTPRDEPRAADVPSTQETP